MPVLALETVWAKNKAKITFAICHGAWGAHVITHLSKIETQVLGLGAGSQEAIHQSTHQQK